MTPPIIANAGPLLARYDARVLRRLGRHAQRPHGLCRGRRGPGALPRRRAARSSWSPTRRCPPPASSACWRRPACGATPGTRSSARATSRCAHIAEKGYRRLHRIGPARRDSRLFARLPGPNAPLAEAEAIVCTGLVDEINRDGRDLPSADRGGRCAQACRSCAPIPIWWSTSATSATCAPAASPPSTSAAAAACSGPASRILSAYAAALERAGELRGAAPDRSSHPRHRRCRAHRSCRRAGHGRRRAVHRLGHPQRRGPGRTARSIPASSLPCSRRRQRRRPLPPWRNCAGDGRPLPTHRHPRACPGEPVINLLRRLLALDAGNKCRHDGDYRPWNFGLRFSMKARRPSM